jgi:HEAT repeat protein
MKNPFSLKKGRALLLAAALPLFFPAYAEEVTDDAPAPETLQKVLRLLRTKLSEDGEERTQATQELRAMGNLALPAFLAMHREGIVPEELLPVFLTTLNDLKDPRVADLCLERLAHQKIEVRMAAARTLAGCARPADLPFLIKRLDERSETGELVRFHAAVGAARLGAQEGLVTLLKLCDSPAGPTRSLACFQLGRLAPVGRGNDELAATLVRLIGKDQDPVVRQDAISALLQLIERTKNVAPPKNDIQRWNAAGKEIVRTAENAWLNALDDADYKVRAEAVAALEAHSKQSFGRDKEAWKKWHSKATVEGDKPTTPASDSDAPEKTKTTDE